MEYPEVTLEEEEAWFISLNSEELDSLWKKWITDLGPPEEPAFRSFDPPPELRNRVYHFALGNNGNPVLITKNLRPPGLLSTCAQIRDEALHIWYATNDFRITIVNCDASLFLAWEKHLENLGNGMDGKTKLGVRLRHPDWNNLVDWCHRIWNIELPIIPSSPAQDRTWKVVRAAQKIAHGSAKRVPWKVCRTQIEAIREMAGKFDKRWLN